jgi:lysophospholipase L1-like esterase
MCVIAAKAGDSRFTKKYLFGNTGITKGIIKVDTTAIFTDDAGFGLKPAGKLETNAKGSKSIFIASEKPFYFETQLPEGRYKITLVLGGNAEGSSTTLKAESRRLMFENFKTKPGKTAKKVIIVDVRTPQINDSEGIKLKPRELNYLNWDNKLTLEFNGDKPCVSSIAIKRVDTMPTIFLAGNSTVTDQENEPWASWGQMFPRFLKPNVVVANYAESGETLLSFKRAKRLQKILSRMKSGDYLFIEFAHNDQKQGGNHLDAFTTYKDELKHYIAETRKKGGKPVLVTSMHRRRFDESGKIINTLENYPEAVRQVAAEESVLLIDLNAMSKDLYEALGPENSKKAFVHYPANSFPGQEKALADDTHFNPYGAYLIAKCIVSAIIQDKMDLSKYLLDPTTIFNPKNPEAVNDFHWFESPMVDVVKPDGN